MLSKLREFVYPKTIGEAIQVLRDHPGVARPIAGGTALSQLSDDRTEILVDITRLGLADMEEEPDGLRLHACATAERVGRWRTLRESWAAALWDACRVAGPAGVRNAMTLGGSLVQCYPWSDPPVALLALDAKVEVMGDGVRMVPASEMFTRHPRSFLEPWELVTSFVLERPGGRAASAFLKESETATTYALASAAAYAEAEDRDDGGLVLKQVRVVVGAVRSLPVRIEGLEELWGRTVDEGLMEEVGSRVYDQVEPLEDARASKGYRRHLAAVLARRAVGRALERLGVDGAHE